MKMGSLIAFAIFILAVGGDALGAAIPEPKKAPSESAFQVPTTAIKLAQKAAVKSALMKQPLGFVKNQGQFHSDHLGQQVQFYEQRKGNAIYFTQDGVYLHLVKFKDASVKEDQTGGVAEIAANSLVRLSLIGSAKQPEIIPERLQPGKVNYYLGSDHLHGWGRDERNIRLFTEAGLQPVQDTAIISRLVSRRDGFISVRAAYSGGEFTTTPVIFAGAGGDGRRARYPWIVVASDQSGRSSRGP